MSKRENPTIHIEWSHNRVTAVDTHTGQVVTRDSLLELSGVFGKSKDVLVGISRSLVFLKAIRLPKADPDDVRKMLEVQLGQFFPLPASQLTFDCYQTTDHNVEGSLTLVAAIRTEDLIQLKSALQLAGWRSAGILPVALGSAVVAGIPDAIVLEHTMAGLALDVIQNGVLRLSRTVPIESDPVCEAQRTLIAARAGSLPLVTVGDLYLPGAQTAKRSPLIALHEALPFHWELAADRILAEKRRIAGRTRLAGLMFMASLLMVVLLWVEYSDAAAIVKKGEAKWTSQLTVLRKLREVKLKRAGKSSLMAGTLKGAFETRQPLSDVTLLISDSMPEGAWLTGLVLERGKPIQLRGTAKSNADVTKLVDALNISPRLREVHLVFANSAKIEDIPVVQYSITAIATGNMPMPNPVKKSTKAAKKPAKTDDSAVGEPKS